MILHSLPTIEDDDIAAVVDLLKSRQLHDGAVVHDLELKMANFVGRDYAISASSGFGAIHLALLALEVTKGDEVVIPSYTCSALLHPIALVGARAVIADISEDGFNSGFNQIEEKISSHTKAIILPHTFGFPAVDIPEIKKLGVPIIEDCAQALGGDYKGQKLGSFGDIAIFSFYASKVIAAGDGGMVLTNNKEWADRARAYRSYNGIKGRSELTLNYRLTNLPARLALSQLQKVDQFIARRNVLAKRYLKGLEGVKQVKMTWEGAEDSMYYRFIISVPDLLDLKNYLKDQGIHTGFGVLENMHPLMDLPDEEYPNAAKRLKQVLSLPIYPSLSESEVDMVCEKIRTYYSADS